MTIISSEQSYDMGSWVAEKSSAVLERGCELVDWLRETDAALPQEERERIAASLRALIYDAAKLAAFGHENLGRWSPQQVERLYNQGSKGLPEFHRHISQSVPQRTNPMGTPVAGAKPGHNGAHPQG